MKKKSQRERKLELLLEEFERERIEAELRKLEDKEYEDNPCYSSKKKRIVYWKSQVGKM